MNPDRKYRKSDLPENAKRVFEGKIFDVYQWEQKLYDGTTATFEKIARPDTVTIFPILDDGRILLIEDSQPHRETILTSPAGRVDNGETPEEAAKRELHEETGYISEMWEPFYVHEPYGKIDWVVYAFIAKKLKKDGEPHFDPGEEIKEHPVTFDELIDLVRGGEKYRDDFTQVVLEAVADPLKMTELRKKLSPL